MKQQISDIESTNFLDLVHKYFDKTDAQLGAKSIASSVPEGKLDVLLRSHLIREVVSRREIEARDGLDDLLAFYSVLEIGFLCGSISELPTTFKDKAREQLSRPAVRRYYDKFYPLLLPRLFLDRLSGDSRLVRGDNAFQVFAAFLALNASLDDEDVQIFLWFLDDGTFVEGDHVYELADVLQLLRDGQRFARRLLKSPAKQATVDQALHGFVKFSGFCFEFDRLLREAPVAELTKSAMWHFHGYWFQQIGGQVLGVIGAAIEQYRDWVPPINAETNKADAALITATKDSMDRGHRALRRLTSSIYRFALEQAALREKIVKPEIVRSETPTVLFGRRKAASLFNVPGTKASEIEAPKAKTSETGPWDFPILGA